MTSLILATVLHLSLAATPAENYAEAHRKTIETGRPMVVLVGAEWCPACKDMENRIIPRIRRALLGRVVYCHVDLDQERDLGRKLTAGGPIPQLIAFRRTEDGWRNVRLIGGQSVEKVEEFINQQVATDEAKGQAEKPTSAGTAEKPAAEKPATAKKKTPARPVSTGD